MTTLRVDRIRIRHMMLLATVQGACMRRQFFRFRHLRAATRLTDLLPCVCRQCVRPVGVHAGLLQERRLPREHARHLARTVGLCQGPYRYRDYTRNPLIREEYSCVARRISRESCVPHRLVLCVMVHATSLVLIVVLPLDTGRPCGGDRRVGRLVSDLSLCCAWPLQVIEKRFQWRRRRSCTT
jgi:hypothetical protein